MIGDFLLVPDCTRSISVLLPSVIHPIVVQVVLREVVDPEPLSQEAVIEAVAGDAPLTHSIF